MPKPPSWPFTTVMTANASDSCYWIATCGNGRSRAGPDHRVEDPGTQRVTLLLSSGEGVDRDDALDAGIEPVLVKPVRNRDLLQRIINGVANESLLEASSGH